MSSLRNVLSLTTALKMTQKALADLTSQGRLLCHILS